MPLKHAPIMLEEMAKGGVLEHFAAGLRKVKEDIDDPSKKSDAKRSFDIRFTVEPDAEGHSAKILVELLPPKLAPSRPAVTSVFLAHEAGQLEMLEVQQQEIPRLDNTVSINRKKEN